MAPSDCPSSIGTSRSLCLSYDCFECDLTFFDTVFEVHLTSPDVYFNVIWHCLTLIWIEIQQPRMLEKRSVCDSVFGDKLQKQEWFLVTGAGFLIAVHLSTNIRRDGWSWFFSWVLSLLLWYSAQNVDKFTAKWRHVTIESGERELDSNPVLAIVHSNGHKCHAYICDVRNYQ